MLDMWKDEPEVGRFLELVRTWALAPATVCELGSYAMHDHNPRPLWPGAAYVGVDWRAGPGVDVVGLTHERGTVLELGPESQDLVLSISVLEHDPFWDATLRAALELVRPGGVVAVTCAGPGWGEHEHDCAPPIGGRRGHYRNVSVTEILAMLTTHAHILDIEFQRVEGFYSRRTLAPHWLRSCVLVQTVEMSPQFQDQR